MDEGILWLIHHKLLALIRAAALELSTLPIHTRVRRLFPSSSQIFHCLKGPEFIVEKQTASGVRSVVSTKMSAGKTRFAYAGTRSDKPTISVVEAAWRVDGKLLIYIKFLSRTRPNSQFRFKFLKLYDVNAASNERETDKERERKGERGR